MYRYRMTDAKHILMLDDERFLLDMYRMSFEKNGYEVSTYRNVDDALAVLRAGAQPDAILFDISMPDSKSGYEFIETIGTEKLAPRALKIALTNSGQDGQIARIKELGADAHLLKANYLPAELAAEISALLESHS